MSNDSSDKNDGNSFEYRLKEVSDEEIVNILRYREHFQQHAVKAAIKEALKRGLINSIEDLNNQQFQKQEIESGSLFPLGTNKKQSNAILKSLCRIVYGIGLLPIISGIIQISDQLIIAGISTLLIGILVIYLANRLDKTKRIFYANLLLFLNIPAISYAIYFIISERAITTMDKVAVLIVVLVMLYITFYMKKLSKYFNRKENDR
jgi:hypothetical protein